MDYDSGTSHSIPLSHQLELAGLASLAVTDQRQIAASTLKPDWRVAIGVGNLSGDVHSLLRSLVQI